MTSHEQGRDDDFSYRATKAGLVLISHRGKRVTTLSGTRAARFLMTLESGDSHTAQLAMAKATGHFKHDSDNTAKHDKRDR